ncbi:P-loop NTPase [Halomarina pelagica]|uniref:P-loop NTPase n=1 Tax=Halomarina pelagica TaxID=2961599 RepID=UPI0020C53ED7|nr:P-loop NTPase [Halomarina sp. BND7]
MDEHTTDAILRERVEAALRDVSDPELDRAAFDAGLVERIRVDDGEVVVEADPSGFDPSVERATRAMLRAVRDVPGVRSAHVEPTAAEAGGRTPGVDAFDTVVAVASAKGGVGKSTVATALACALAGEADVGLFDADVHGPNVPSLLDVEGPIRADEEGHPLPVEASGPDATLEAMSVGFMASGAPLAWRGAMVHDAVTELFAETAWLNRDTLVVDLPPGTGDVVLTTLQEIEVDGVVVVTTPFPTSVEDTNRSVDLFRENGVPVLGAVVNMGGFTCPSCGDTHSLFPGGSPEAALDAPVVAELPFSPALQRTPTPGDAADAVDRLAAEVSRRVTEAWELDAPDDAVDLRGATADERRARVRERFTALDSGDPFHLVSDRDPSPVRGFLAELAGVEPEAIEPFRVERRTPEGWVLRARHP